MRAGSNLCAAIRAVVRSGLNAQYTHCHQAVGINGRKLSYLWRLFAWSYEAAVAGALIIVSHQGITHSALANRMAVVVWGSAF